MSLSVIIPTRNRPASCSRLLTALLPQIDHLDRGADIEVIVVDDCSSPSMRDQLRSHISGPRFESTRLVLRESAGGPSAARNTGITRARGDILAFLDDDCVPERGFLTEVLRLHEKYPGVELINGNLRALRHDSISRFWFYYYDHAFNCGSGEIYEIQRVSAGNFSIKRSLLKRLDPLFDEALPSREDYDLYLRLRQKGIPTFKADSIGATIECRRTIREFLKQRAWYERGEIELGRKYGAAFLRAQQAGQYPSPSPAFIHIHAVLYIARKIRSLIRIVLQ